MSDGDTLLLPARVSLVHPVVSCAHYFQAPATRCKCNIQFSVRLEFLNQLQGLTTCCRENGKIGLPEMSYNLCNFIVNKLRLERCLRRQNNPLQHLTRGIFRSNLHGILQKTDGDVLSGFSSACHQLHVFPSRSVQIAVLPWKALKFHKMSLNSINCRIVVECLSIGHNKVEV